MVKFFWETILNNHSEGEIKKKTGLGIMYEGLKTGLLRLQDLTFPRTTVEHFLNTYETKKRLKVL